MCTYTLILVVFSEWGGLEASILHQFHVTLSACSGLLGVFCKCLLESLDRLPGDARTMVGVLTYDSTLHFYNLNVSQRSPRRDSSRGWGVGGGHRDPPQG
jgi:hypothetical protein